MPSFTFYVKRLQDDSGRTLSDRRDGNREYNFFFDDYSWSGKG